MKFTLCEGSLSENFNIYNEYRFKECYATNTRLMGVVAMRLLWVSKTNPDKYLHQLIHLDYSEYGIDEYFEFIEEKNKEIIPIYGDSPDMIYSWKKMSTCLGGSEKKISLTYALNFICSSLLIGKKYFKYHDNDIKKFQLYSFKRINYMLSSLGLPDFENYVIDDSDYMFSLFPVDMTAVEIVNYFIMRLIDKDYDAASMLSHIPPDLLANNKLSRLGILTLMINRSELTMKSNKEGIEQSVYTCKSLLLGNEYYYSILNVVINKSSSNIKYKVSNYNVEFINRISTFEAALQLRKVEYITTFKINGNLEEFDARKMFFMLKGLPYRSAAGILYMIYNSNNSHVKSEEYYMNDDVYGAILVTDYGEVIVMSSDITRIDMLEKIIMASPAAIKIDLLDRYKFENQIFQSFTKSSGMSFENFLDEYE